jgi:hypothetical protein
MPRHTTTSSRTPAGAELDSLARVRTRDTGGEVCPFLAVLLGSRPDTFADDLALKLDFVALAGAVPEPSLVDV